MRGTPHGITEGRAGADGKRDGPYAANRAMRTFRAVWNSARKRNDLPQCPTIACEYNRGAANPSPTWKNGIAS